MITTLELKALEKKAQDNGITLLELMENAGRIQTRSMLENRLYSWGEEVSSNAVEVHIHHLRKKLGNDFIKTVRGVGYKVITA